jgi:hypothetical protein
MSQPQHDALLRQAIELAKSNKRAEARQMILKVVTQDEENARAWMLLAQVTTDLNERRTALMNVVNLEPFNNKAQEALAKLEGQLAISRAIGEDPAKEVGQRRVMRSLLFALIGIMAVTIIGVVIFVLINSTQTQNNDSTNATAQATLEAGTSIAELAIAATETGVQQAIFDITETYVAFPTSTPTPRPTLPPENTATPTITPTATITSIPRPEGLPGQIIGWGGRLAVEGETNFPIVFISMADGSIREISGSNRGQQVFATDTTRVIYQRFFRDAFRSEISKVDPVTGISEVLSSEWQGTQLAFGETAWPHTSLDGRWMVFSAESADTGTRDIYLYDRDATGEKLRRLTNDGNDHDMPTISPDGTRAVAVRQGRTPNPPNVDLVLIDIASGSITAWTEDGDQTIEAMPRWSPDGKLVAYVVIDQESDNGDIYLRTVEGVVNVLPVTRSADIDETNPVFSPDTRYMAYASDFTEGYNIFIYDLLTGDFSQLTFDDENYFPGAWLE